MYSKDVGRQVERFERGEHMDFIYSDGGRSKYFKAEHVGDCCVRAICNATGMDYKEVYDALNRLAKTERTGKRKKKVSNAREGVYKKTADKYLKSLGWKWKPTMGIGTGCTVHVKADELPSGNLVLNLSRHFTCVKDGVLYDTYDCSKDGTRCVYGYWYKPENRRECVPIVFTISRADDKGNVYKVSTKDPRGEYMNGLMTVNIWFSYLVNLAEELNNKGFAVLFEVD